ncbi:restriction endonuclease subunit S [Acinetobacter indicus]|uniref:restriction endonuclease subunit S n=1 Tax=Acinetobacter indicus TaxID=756892 RepID=UPI000FD9F243|nr:restriction endonuclease subunit S [Acinetobacter indicus]RVT46814.1 restriction endonuclease subunit S [Acinetobacter indicus]
MAAPKLRFKEFDGDWERIKLSQMGTFKNGINKDKEDFGHGVPFINLMDVFGKNSICQNTFDLVNASSKEIEAYSLKQGDVLFIRSSVKPEGVAETAVVLEDLDNTVYSGFLIRYRPSKDIDLHYKKYCFSTDFFRKNVLALSTTSANTNINQESLSLLNLDLPSKQEQTKIATFLSAVDEKISQLTQKHELLSQYKQGMMQKLFSQEIRFKADDGSEFGEWEEKNILKIADVSIGLVTTMTTNYREKGTPLIRNSDIKPNNILKNKLIFLDSDFADSYENRKLKVNDIVTVHTGDVGVSSLIPEELNGAIGFATINTRVIDENVSPCYLVWYFNSKKFINWCVNYSTGDGRQNLNLKDFNTAVIPLPSLEEQTKIANLLSAIDQKVEVVAQQIEQAKIWKKGLLQQMFV